MKQPEGYVVSGKENLVCKLKKSMYGLKQSPKCWNSVLDTFLKSIGFVITGGDPCLYCIRRRDVFIAHVDDIVLAGKNDEEMLAVKQAIGQQFHIKDKGELHYFLGVKVVCDFKTGYVWIGQQSYIQTILRKYCMEDCKTIQTPVDSCTKLIKGGESDTYVDQRMYQSAVGSLLYLSLATRSDITYAVSNAARFCGQHWAAVK